VSPIATRSVLRSVLAAGTVISSLAVVSHHRAAEASSATPVTLAQLSSDIAKSVALKSAPNPILTVPPLHSMTGADTSLVPVRSHCDASSAPTSVVALDVGTTCAYGDLSATRTILLTGDSQAAMWLPAVDAMGQRTKWRVVALAMRECGPWGSPNPARFLLYRNVTVADCSLRNRAVSQWAVLHHPEVVLFAGRAYPAGYNLDVAPQLSVVLLEMAQEVASYKNSNSTLIVLGPIPRYNSTTTKYSPTNCLEGVTAMTNCQLAPTRLLPATEVRAETIEVRAHLFHYAKLYPLMCTTVRCTIVVNDGSEAHLVYFNGAHINRFFATWSSGAFQEILAKLLPT
jgi:hypothetical protein